MTSEPDAESHSTGGAATVSLRELFQVFSTIGMTSFGSGLSGWMFRELVERRQWLSTTDFMAGLSLARAMPGINVINLAIWIGYRLRKGLGALVAICGVLGGPMALIILCAMLYRRWGRSVEVHQVLLGITAAALGLSLSMGLKSLVATATRPFYAVVVLLVFAGVGVLHWPMLSIVAVMAPISIAWAFFEDERHEG